MRFDAALLEKLALWYRAGSRVCLATVAKIEGSSPRSAGACIAIREGGGVHGAISNGCVEAEIVENAKAVFADGEMRVLRFGVGDGVVETALLCGGTIAVTLVRLEEAFLEELIGEVATGRPFAITLDPSAQSIGASLNVGEDVVFDDLSMRLVLRIDPPLRLVLLGAGDISEALAIATRALGYAVTLVDPRRDYVALYANPRNYDAIVYAWPESVIDEFPLGEEDAVVSLFHEARFELDALAYLLTRTRAYVGALGSRRVQAERLAALIERGVTRAELARLHAPVGLDIGADAPAEIAVAIAAELVAARNGRAGAPLRDGTGPITRSNQPVR